MDAAWIAIASILTCFKISKAVDEKGNVIEPAIEYTDGLVVSVSSSYQFSPITDDFVRIATQSHSSFS